MAQGIRTVKRPNVVYTTSLKKTYTSAFKTQLAVSDGRVGLVLALYHQLDAGRHTRTAVCDGSGTACPHPGHASDLEYRSGQSIHQQRLHSTIGECQGADQHGRERRTFDNVRTERLWRTIKYDARRVAEIHTTCSSAASRPYNVLYRFPMPFAKTSSTHTKIRKSGLCLTPFRSSSFLHYSLLIFHTSRLNNF